MSQAPSVAELVRERQRLEHATSDMQALRREKQTLEWELEHRSYEVIRFLTKERNTLRHLRDNAAGDHELRLAEVARIADAEG